MTSKGPTHRSTIAGCLLLVLLGWSLSGLAQDTTIVGHVYIGVPPGTEHPAPNVTVSLYGDDDSLPDNGPLVLLAQANSDSAGGFTLVWSPLRIQVACLHVRVELDNLFVAVGAQATRPGEVVDPHTVAFLDVPAGTYPGLAFWVRMPGTSGSQLPDLVLEAVTLDPPSPGPGDSVQLLAKIVNAGSVAAGAFEVRFVVDGVTLPASLSIGGLSPGGQSSVGTRTAPLPAGEHVIEAIADPDDHVEESDETNNRVLLRVTLGAASAGPARPLPDLAIEAVDLSPRSAPAGVNRTLSCTVANLGTASVPSAVLAVVDSHLQSLATHSTPALSPGERTSLSLEVRPRAAGEQTLWVRVDPQGSVAESDESNNQASLAVWVVDPPKPDLVLAGITGLLRLPGVPDRIAVVIENRGEAAAEAFAVEVRSGESPVCAPQIVDGLAADTGTEVVLFIASAATALTVIADAGDWIVEGDESNNARIWNPPQLLLPDLAIESLDATADPVRPGGWILSVTISNRGTAAATGGQLLVSVVDPIALAQAQEGGTSEWLIGQAQMDLPNLLPGMAHVWADPQTLHWEPGLVVLAQVDPFDLLLESDETHNEAQWPTPSEVGGE